MGLAAIHPRMRDERAKWGSNGDAHGYRLFLVVGALDRETEDRNQHFFDILPSFAA